MKLKSTFISHVSAGEQILVDVTNSFSGLIRSNKTAAFIVDQLKTETTRENIVAAMLEQYDASEDVISRDVDTVLTKLRSVGALEE